MLTLRFEQHGRKPDGNEDASAAMTGSPACVMGNKLSPRAYSGSTFS